MLKLNESEGFQKPYVLTTRDTLWCGKETVTHEVLTSPHVVALQFEVETPTRNPVVTELQ